MKRLLITLLCFVPFISEAQDKLLMVEGSSPDLYVNHTVAPKENYYSIGRMYNISPKEVAPFNGLQLEKGLSLGQTVKIPLKTTANFLQTGNAAADEALVPVYHTVQDKEGLYRISVTYNKVPVATLKQWNNITGESVSNGTKLIVGYLKVKKELSPLAGGQIQVVPTTTQVTPAEKPKPVVKEAEKPKVEEKPKPVVKTEEKPKPVVKPAEKEPVKTPEKPTVTETVKKDPPKETKPVETVKEEVTTTPWKNFNGGVFKTDFDKQSHNNDVANENGAAAIFKSTSGWEDGKYYCLHNTASPGTIVKITNTVSGKVAYAKVLDVIPDIKQNTGILIRISNAAAEELGVAQGKFDCLVTYTK